MCVRAHRLGQRGEAADVAEQHGHRSLVAAEPDRFRRFGDALRELRREEALEVAAHDHLALNALRRTAPFSIATAAMPANAMQKSRSASSNRCVDP